MLIRTRCVYRTCLRVEGRRGGGVVSFSVCRVLLYDGVNRSSVDVLVVWKVRVQCVWFWFDWEFVIFYNR